jgi:hypothetical protein
VTALLYFAMGLIFALIFVPFMNLVPSNSEMTSEQQQAFDSIFRGFMLAYPFFGAVTGWIFGLGATVVYNLIARYIGGLRFEMQESGATVQHTAA